MLRRADGLVIAVLLTAALLAWAGVSILKTRAERADCVRVYVGGKHSLRRAWTKRGRSLRSRKTAAGTRSKLRTAACA